MILSKIIKIIMLPPAASETEILRRIGIARDCFFLLEKNIWRSHIHTETKVQLYRTYILPVLLYGCETWTVTRTLENVSMHLTPGVCGKFCEFRTPGTLPTRQYGVLPGARQFQIG